MARTQKLKVYGWQGWRTACPAAPNGSRTTRDICATTSMKRCRELAGNPRGGLFNLCETGNAEEIATAMAEPHVIFWLPADQSYLRRDLRKMGWQRATPGELG